MGETGLPAELITRRVQSFFSSAATGPCSRARVSPTSLFGDQSPRYVRSTNLPWIIQRRKRPATSAALRSSLARLSVKRSTDSDRRQVTSVNCLRLPLVRHPIEFLSCSSRACPASGCSAQLRAGRRRRVRILCACRHSVAPCSAARRPGHTRVRFLWSGPALSGWR